MTYNNNTVAIIKKDKLNKFYRDKSIIYNLNNSQIMF